MAWNKTDHDAGKYMDREYYPIIGRLMSEANYHYNNRDLQSLYETLLNLLGHIPEQLHPLTKEKKDSVILTLLGDAYEILSEDPTSALWKLWTARLKIFSILYEHSILFSTWEKKKRKDIVV